MWTAIRYGIYVLAALQAAALVVFTILFATTPNAGGDSGGHEMALFFFILLPAAILCASVSLYRFARWRAARLFAAAVILISSAVLASWYISENGL